MFVLWLSLICVVWGKNRVMPQMCLERCNFNSSEIQSELQTIKQYSSVLSGVSYELFNLGPDSELITNNFTQVTQPIKDMNLETYAMISSYPYPNEFIDWMRQLFNNSEPFIQQCIKKATELGFTGFTVDFEPTVNGTSQHATDYANFSNLFARRLHENNIKVLVCVATWNPLWDWAKIGATAVDRILVMSTYAGNQDTWLKYLQEALKVIPLEKIGVGLETIDSETKQPLTDAELAFRFNNLQQNHLNEVDIWDMPLKDNWWPFLTNFAQS